MRLIGREHLTRQVLDRFATSRVVAIAPNFREPSGLSAGWGLTSAALAVADALAEGTDLTLRLRADSDVHWHADILATVRRHKLPERLVRRPDHPLIGLRRLLRQAKSPLVILDDVTQSDRIRDLISTLPHAKFLLTSRVAPPPGVSEVSIVLVDPLEEAAAVELLLDRLPKDVAEAVATSGKLLNLARSLECHPAALSLAAETIRLTDCTLEEFSTQLASLPAVSVKTTASELPPDIGQSPLWRVARLLLHRMGDVTETNSIRDPLLLRAAFGAEHLSTVMDPTGGQQALPGLSPVGLSSFGTSSDESSPVFSHPVSSSISEALMSAAPATLHRQIVERAHEHWQQVRQQGGQVEEIVQHGDALLRETARHRAFVQSRRPFVALVRDLALGVGACERATTLGLEYVTSTREATGDLSLNTSLAYEGLARVQRAWDRVLPARRTFRRAIAIVESMRPVPLPQWVRLECEVAEADLDECKVERANNRLLRIREAVQSIRLEHPYLEARWSFLWAACCLAGRRPDKAADVLQDVLAWQQRKLGLDAYETLKTRSLLARALFTQKRFPETEAILRRDLEIRTTSSAVTPSEEVVPTNFLAEMLFVQGRYTEAESFFQRVLEIRVETLGATHRLVGETSNRLAVLRGTRGDYKGAEPMFRRALSIAEEVYGESHPEVAKVLNDLAEMLFTQGRYDQSRRLLERAQRIQERTLRKSDPKVSRTRNNLAAVYVAHGHYDAACKLYQEDVAARQNQGQADDLRMATALNNLGDVQRSIGKLVEAEHNLKGALLIREQILGPEHPQVAQALNNLGYLYLNQYRLPEAGEAIERALTIRRRTLSSEHPHVANALSTLASVRFWDQQYEAAVPLLEEAEQITRTVFGEKHQQVAVVMALLGRCELRLGRRAKGELHLLKSRMIFEETVGPNHRLYADVLIGLGELAELEGKDEQAFPFYERAIAIQRQTMSAPRLEMATTLQSLGFNLLRRNRTSAACERLSEALRIQQKLVPEESPLLILPLIRLADASLRNGDRKSAEKSLRHALHNLDHHTVQGNTEWQLQLREEASLMLVDLCISRREFQEASATLTRLLDAPSTVPEEKRDARLLALKSRLASLRVLEREYAEAEPLQRECLELSRKIDGRQSAEVAKHLESLSLTLSQLGKNDEADTLIQESISICEHVYGDGHEEVARALDQRAALLYRAKKTQEAEALERHADALRGRESHVLDDIM
ncbi:MAG: tetratricopeptide repeat protein [Planctomycetaceae bacterium]